MGHPRIGHTATVLGDGRVLVTGGLANYQGADTQLAAALSTAQNTGEVYNPATGTWTPIGNAMSSVRSGHAAVREADGRVLLISGVNGGVVTSLGSNVPTFTATCDRYDPATNTFASAPAIPLARGFHGATTLASGELLVTGGLITAGPFGEALATSTCYRFNGTTWTQTGSLPIGVAFHSQVALKNGSAHVSGGYLGDFVTLVATASSGVHNGTTFTAGAPLGTNIGAPATPASPRGSHSMTELWDGSFLLLGGFHSPDTTTILVKDDGFIYTR
jgi:N-acetylneuraminic acid mutarotase